MTDLLDRAVATARSLSPDSQDRTGASCARMDAGTAERGEDGRIWLWDGELTRTHCSMIGLR